MSTTGLSAITLFACAAAIVMASSAANAYTYNIPTCDVFMLGGCADLFVTVKPGRRVVRDTPPPRHISPTSMKQSDPRYNSAMNEAGGGGGGGGAGGGGAGGR